jgi:hypothetical protein
VEGHSNLSNLEAILNIGANLTEIAGLRTVFGLAVASFLLLFIKRWLLAAQYFGIAVALTIFALAVPGIINYLSGLWASNDALYMLLVVGSGLLGAISFFGTFAILAVPGIIAGKKKVTNNKTIVSLSMLGILIPIFWGVALFLAHKLRPAGELDPNKNLLR